MLLFYWYYYTLCNEKMVIYSGGIAVERDFRYLRDKYTDAGARDIFEKICTQWLQYRFGTDAHRIRVSQGDGGIDVLVGDFSQPIDVYQCKYFIDGVGDSQKKQIRESYERAKNASDYRLKNWYLCVPCELSIKEFSWWSDWKSKKENFDHIPISLCEGSYLIGELKKVDLYNDIFDEKERKLLEEIQAYLIEIKSRIFEEIIALPTENEESLYDGMIFVKKLECANIREISGCKADYFNAEFALQSIQSKGNEDEIRAYNQLKIKIFSFWQTQYRQCQDESDGNKLLTKTYERIEDSDTTALKSIAAINLLAKKGILHQLAEECSVGWLKEYKAKLEAYLAKKREGGMYAK